ncbi:hypothetical protein [Fuerstiella marisgermanici]|uniref:Uncharacterized protein n=1 Tax=Fuerstiella marisgermanici TaxID=1891926 RepID=A0A1P8WR25_9PLAN|nr:hypothetical protein [Fuerstiella marisgermanici]APZ96489.1 hypothetical protein Fuma_06158 [Fuerstiella marisgermanici]
MNRILEFSVMPIIWGGIVLSALSMHDMRGFGQHSVCGPWGCGPPTNALLAIHIGWAAAIWPALFYLPWRLSFTRNTVKTIVLSLTVSGLIGLLTITAWQWIVWLPNASEWARSYIWHRCGFAILTAADWPFLQLLGGGILLGALQLPASHESPGHSAGVPVNGRESATTV